VLLLGARRPRIAGRLLPQPRGLVLAQRPRRRIGELRLPVERLQQQGVQPVPFYPDGEISLLKLQFYRH
jgi:hypothetical protein